MKVRTAMLILNVTGLVGGFILVGFGLGWLAAGGITALAVYSRPDS